jgi:hypothetical protein
MKSAYRICIALAIGCAPMSACLAPESAPEPESVGESAPPFEEESSSGTPPCTLGAICTSGGLQGKCAKNPSTGAAMCCTGCVDAYGYCRAGNFAQVCGFGGASCSVCLIGETCPSGVCVTNCTEPGGACMSGAGTYGNGPSGACICCTGCWTVDGTCVSGDVNASLCGHSGSYCQDCGSPPYATTACAGGVCAITSCAAGRSNCNSDVTDGCETPSSTCP